MDEGKKRLNDSDQMVYHKPLGTLSWPMGLSQLYMHGQIQHGHAFSPLELRLHATSACTSPSCVATIWHISSSDHMISMCIPSCHDHMPHQHTLPFLWTTLILFLPMAMRHLSIYPRILPKENDQCHNTMHVFCLLHINNHMPHQQVCVLHCTSDHISTQATVAQSDPVPRAPCKHAIFWIDRSSLSKAYTSFESDVTMSRDGLEEPSKLWP